MKNDARVQKMVKELKDTENQLSIQQSKLNDAEEALKKDNAVLEDYENQLKEAIKDAKIDDLKDLNKRKQGLERDIRVYESMIRQLNDSIEILSKSIAKQKEELRQLLVFIVKKKKITLEYGQVADLLNEFLEINAEFVDEVRGVFREYGLQRMEPDEISLNLKGNYDFVQHSAFIGLAMPMPMEIVNTQSHKKFFEKKVKRYGRIISGEKKTPKTKVETEKPEKPNIVEKVLKTGSKKMAKKVSPEEMENIFS